MLLAALVTGVLAAPWLAATSAHAPDGPRARAQRPRLPDVSSHIPADHVLAEQIEEAVDLGRRRRFDRMFDALDPGEAIEHATLRQTAQDRRSLGIDALFAVEDGMLTTMVAYLAQLEIPIIRPPRHPRLLDAFARGSARFDDLGCDRCHRRTLLLENPVIEVRPAQQRYADRSPVRIDVARDGETPKIEPDDGRRAAYRVHLFSDLKRHDMGPALATPTAQGGIPPPVFLTRPLWGLADTAPYLHDGRAPTVHDAIHLHGGEARAARDAYLALAEDERGALRVFLLSLTREPRLTAR